MVPDRGILLVVLFGYAMSWIFTTVGLAVKDPETAQAAAFPALAPLVVASAAFVVVDNMPGWLQPWARNQPVSVTTGAFRALTIGGPTADLVTRAIVWSVVIIAIFAPIAGAAVPQSGVAVASPPSTAGGRSLPPGHRR